jgi:hypothetical protein
MFIDVIFLWMFIVVDAVETVTGKGDRILLAQEPLRPTLI